MGGQVLNLERRPERFVEASFMIQDLTPWLRG